MAEISPAGNNKQVKQIEQLLISTSSTQKGESQVSSSSLKNVLYYCTLLNHYGIEDMMYAILIISLPSLTPLLQQEQYFNIPKEDSLYFNKMFLNTFNIGQLVGGFSTSLFAKYTRVSWTRLVLRLTIIGTIFTCFIYDSRLLFVSRSIQGFCIGVLQPLNLTEAFRLSPNNHKSIVGNFISVYVTTGIIIGMVLIYFSNIGAINWQIIFFSAAGIEILAVIVNIFYHKVDLSFHECLKRGDEKSARKILSVYLFDEFVNEIIEDEKENLKMMGKNKESHPIRTNWREFLVGMFFAVVMVVTFSTSYTQFVITLSCKDIRSVEEATQVSRFTSISSVLEVIPKALQIFFPILVRRRKVNFIISAFCISASWSLMAWFYYLDNWSYIKYMIFPWFFAIGVLIFPSYFSVLGDLLTGELMGIVFSLTKILEIGAQNLMVFVLEYFREDMTIYWKISCFLAAVSFVIMILIWVFFFETQGMTKVQIHNRLKGIKHEDDKMKNSIINNSETYMLVQDG